ncbi:hypothetical protein OHR68_25955 [Spirillospora sp. NBC_00431]
MEFEALLKVAFADQGDLDQLRRTLHWNGVTPRTGARVPPDAFSG